MPQRAHLRSVTLGSALRECWREGYGRRDLGADLLAGITVGVIAIPLAMALAIASGVAPQYGLYTAIIAGFVIALTGGSRLSVSGPTAAFVVILYPVAQEFGLSGLLIASLMAGAMMILMALVRLGRLIEYIPDPVTLGFTSGIAVVIATLQIKDFFGLELVEPAPDYFGKVVQLAEALPAFDGASLAVALITLGLLILWPRLRLAVPGHVPAVLAGAGASLIFAHAGMPVDTIGSRFSYLLADGALGQGIPPLLPELVWPWHQPGPQGTPLEWNLELLLKLLPSAFSIAMLGAIESLLCAVVLDGMTGRRHHANGELLGQGLGNLVAPFFGGITATAAIARSTANYRAGACSPLASVFHALTVLASLLLLAPWLAYIPMASMAALLLLVAWNMSEASKVLALLKRAPRTDILVLLVCFSLTVLVDMVVAITAGVLLASLLFMGDIAAMTRTCEISASRKHVPEPLPEDRGVFKISGPLFFAAAERVFAELVSQAEGKRVVILYMDAVPILDAGGLAALERFIQTLGRRNTLLIIADLQFQPLRTLARAGITPVDGRLRFTATLAEAVQLACPGETLEAQDGTASLVELPVRA